MSGSITGFLPSDDQQARFHQKHHFGQNEVINFGSGSKFTKLLNFFVTQALKS